MGRPQQSPGLVDARVLIVALVVCTPAVYRMSEGMLSLTDVLTRYLLVAVGCVAVSALVRFVWPMVSGEIPAPSTTSSSGRTGRAAPAPAAQAANREADPAGDDTSLLGSFDDPAASLLATGFDDDYLELSSPPASD